VRDGNWADLKNMTTVALEEEQQSRAQVESPVSAVVRFWKWSTLFCLVLVAFAVRLSFMLLLGTYRFDRVDDVCGIGEITNIAASIAKGHGFSSPFGYEYTGPTSWIAPVYPYFVALVFRYFGIMTHASSIFIFTVQSLFSALTVIPILGIASRTVGRRAGLWAAWTWILFPWFSKWSVTWLWEISLSAFLFALLFWYALYLPEAPSRKNWIGFGALWGFALLVNPALGSLLPVLLAWCSYSLHLRKREWLKPVLTSLLVCLIVISPWLLRNRVVFGHWVFLRSNFGAEFALGNYHASFGRGWGGKHPSGNSKEYNNYKQIGEIAYVESKQKLAFQFVRESPWEFITLTAKRVAYFWDGSALGYRGPVPWYWVPSSFAVVSFLLLPALLVAHRRDLHAWQMFFGALLLYPLPYYLTFSQVRYRHVLEPVILLLMAYAGSEALSKLTSYVRPARTLATLSTPTTIGPS
jgi:4-amino-4-deoxy-L-arabinose transferase-like glycosyltransferase